VGNTVFGSILRGVLNGQLAPRIASAAIANGYKAANLDELVPAVIDNAVGVPNAFANIPGVTPAIEAATLTAFRSAYAYAFQRVFYSTIPFGVVALVAAFFIADSTKYMTNHTSIEMEKHVLGHVPKHTEHATVGLEEGRV
jgi:hypothetical protein